MPLLQKFLIALLILLASACQNEDRLKFLNPNGTLTQSFKVEFARTPSQIKRGLMYRKSLPQGEGMLFVFPDSKIRSFWMENTYIPLDIIFIDKDGKVVSIQANAKPLTRTSRKSSAPAKFVLEINAGLAESFGIVPGSIMQKNGF